MSFEDTYEETHVHKQEPPPSSIMKFQIEATDRKC